MYVSQSPRYPDMQTCGHACVYTRLHKCKLLQTHMLLNTHLPTYRGLFMHRKCMVPISTNLSYFYDLWLTLFIIVLHYQQHQAMQQSPFAT